MSDVMLCGILRMPPELWSEPTSLHQIQQAALEAATELDRRADEIDRLKEENATMRSALETIAGKSQDWLLGAQARSALSNIGTPVDKRDTD